MPSNDRILQAQRLRQRQHSSNNDELSLVVSGWCTLIGSLLVIGLGAAMAVAFFMIQKPDCMENLGVFNVAAAKSFAAPDNIRGTTKAVVSAGATGLRRLTKNMQEITKF